MVFDNIGNSVRELLGSDENQQAQNDQNLVDEDFADMYSDKLVQGLESQDYERVEELSEPLERDFPELMGDYIEDRMKSASTVFDYFDKKTDEAEKVVDNAASKVRDLKNKEGRMKVEKLEAKPALSMAKNYVTQINKDQSTETMRNAFKAFHMAAHAADYVEQREDIQLEDYDPRKVKAVADKKASDMRDLDEEMGMVFKGREYEILISEYDKL